MRNFIFIVIFLLASSAQAVTRSYTIVKETYLVDGGMILGVHYVDSYGNDEVVIVKIPEKDFKDDKKIQRAVNKEVWKVAASRHRKKHSIKNDPVFKTKKNQRTITIEKVK